MRHLIGAAAALVLATACHVEGGNMNTSFVAAGSGAESRSEVRQSTTTTGPSVPDVPPAPAASGSAAPAPSAPSAPPADVCPLVCHEARGSVSAPLTAEETAQLRTSLEPLMSRLRTCAAGEGYRRRHTPVVHLRIGVDGSVTEHGIDPHHDLASGCFEDASRGTAVNASLPGRKAVRCAERCVVDNGGARRPRGRR
ncbi:MAG: hypothetical protein JST00_18925 [Deltaproteobacteria bacterium]|nr:hypothetical protein [Deltaproteobacteria bacterium]